MTWPSNVVTDVVFIPIYAVLLLASSYTVFKHGIARRFGFLFLVIFCIGELQIVKIVDQQIHLENSTCPNSQFV